LKLVTTKFKSGGLHEKHVVATWSLGNHLSICIDLRFSQQWFWGSRSSGMWCHIAGFASCRFKGIQCLCNMGEL